VLANLRNQIREFAQYAEDCRREAETAPSAVRDHYVKLEKHWLILAQHYLLTLEEAERSYGWASQRTGAAEPLSVFEKAGR
jgi:hypothetical protein